VVLVLLLVQMVVTEQHLLYQVQSVTYAGGGGGGAYTGTRGTGGTGGGGNGGPDLTIGSDGTVNLGGGGGGGGRAKLVRRCWRFRHSYHLIRWLTSIYRWNCNNIRWKHNTYIYC
jgi:hypothetical protein